MTTFKKCLKENKGKYKGKGVIQKVCSKDFQTWMKSFNNISSDEAYNQYQILEKQSKDIYESQYPIRSSNLDEKTKQDKLNAIDKELDELSIKRSKLDHYIAVHPDKLLKERK